MKIDKDLIGESLLIGGLVLDFMITYRFYDDVPDIQGRLLEFRAKVTEEARERLIQAFRESVEKAKPEEKYEGENNDAHDEHFAMGYNRGIDEYRENLLSGLGDKKSSKNNKEK